MATKFKFLGVFAVLLTFLGTQLAMAQDLDYSDGSEESVVEETSEVMVESEESDESMDAESSDDF